VANNIFELPVFFLDDLILFAVQRNQMFGFSNSLVSHSDLFLQVGDVRLVGFFQSDFTFFIVGLKIKSHIINLSNEKP